MTKSKTVLIIILVSFVSLVIFFGIIIALVSLLNNSSGIGRGNIAVIPIKGVITSESGSSILSAPGASSTEIIKLIEKADNDPSVKAIILEINSPGGSAVASDEIGQALKSTDKLKVAWIREIGTSGAYWVASACDEIVANRMSITGSIGVIASYLEFSGLMHEHNVSYERLVAGKYKDVGTPFRKLTPEEKDMLQQQLDSIHDFFIQEVSINRGLDIDTTRELATGFFYIGSDAKEKGLVDILGGKKEAVSYIENKLNIKSKIVEYKKKETLLALFSGIIAKTFSPNFMYPSKSDYKAQLL